MGRVEDKVVVITGAGSGLGEADAHRLSHEGARLVLTDINAEEGRRVADECIGEAIFFEQDVKE
ncbi:MAG TPA: short-chain dehydrogenase, partial [Gammaproteobacteria bacterium]|nr:short-chain dehydrogenase [Gammaproteobacteria bacterium]